MTLSMGVVMFLFALYIGRAEITPEQHGLFLESAKVAFIVFGCSCFVEILASLARGDVRQIGRSCFLFSTLTQTFLLAADDV